MSRLEFVLLIYIYFFKFKPVFVSYNWSGIIEQDNELLLMLFYPNTKEKLELEF